MTTVYAPHKIDKKSDHYNHVKNYMIEHGSPTIMVMDCVDHYRAYEGSHRLAAAEELCVTPDWIFVDPSMLLSDIDHDFELSDLVNYNYVQDFDGDEESLTIGHLDEVLYSRPEIAYRID